jgi:hypothetical protein
MMRPATPSPARPATRSTSASDPTHPLDVGPHLGAIALDVGVNDAGDADARSLLGKRRGPHTCRLRPPFACRFLASRVYPDGNPAGKLAAERGDKRGIAVGHGSENDACRPSAEQRAHGCRVAHAAANLDRNVDG